MSEELKLPALRDHPTVGATFVDYRHYLMHSHAMKIRLDVVAVYLVGNYIGLLILSILLIYLAGGPNVQTLNFNVNENRYNAEFISCIAKMLDAQVSLYLLRGLFINGALFATIFGCLFSGLYQLRIVRNILRLGFLVAFKFATQNRKIRFCIAGIIFSGIAVVNAFWTQPIGPFIFVRWLITAAPMTELFLAGMLSLWMLEQTLMAARARTQTPFEFAIKVIIVDYLFMPLGVLWPDLQSPTAKFLMSCVHDTSGITIFGTTSYYSWLPASALLWDQIFIIFVLFVAGATQLGASRFVIRALKASGKFELRNFFTVNQALNSGVLISMLCLNILLVGLVLDKSTMRDLNMPGFDFYNSITNIKHSFEPVAHAADVILGTAASSG